MKVNGNRSSIEQSRPPLEGHSVQSDENVHSSRVATFFQDSKMAWRAAVLLLMAHACILAYSATRNSPTLNEPGHLVAGLSHWKFGRFELYRVNPPMVRMIAALPVIAVGYEEDWTSFYERPGARPAATVGADFVEANGERAVWLFTIARWACIPVSLAGGLFCFLWSRELWRQNLAGLITLTLWCFEPNILAHAGLFTPDCAATAFGLGAGYLYWRWLRKPSWGRAIAAGVLLGLAELSKMTWIILFGLWPMLWVFWLVSFRRKPNGETAPAIPMGISAQFLQLSFILLIGLSLLNLCYGFDGTFERLGNFRFISSALTGLDQSVEEVGNRFTNSFLSDLPVPFPKQYLIGLDVQKRDFEDYRQLSYMRGEWKNGGWWYYYLYGLTVKTSHGTQMLLAIAIFTWLYFKFAPQFTRRMAIKDKSQWNEDQPERSYQWSDLLVLLAPAVSVLVLASAQLEFNHHLRYVLPLYGFMFVFVGITGNWFRQGKQKRTC